jgi:hypothetical protein
LYDNSFPWVEVFTPMAEFVEVQKFAMLYLAFPAGILRGALSVLEISALITSEIILLPQCCFKIQA